MHSSNRRLQIEQLDKKLGRLRVLKEIELPPNGWINAIRIALNMSLVQLGKKLGITSVSVKEMEGREQNMSITLKKLIEAGEALDLQFVYGFVPKHGSIEKMIEARAHEVAHNVVLRTSQTMKLEDQENSQARLQNAIRERAETIRREMPKYLWD